MTMLPRSPTVSAGLGMGRAAMTGVKLHTSLAGAQGVARTAQRRARFAPASPVCAMPWPCTAAAHHRWRTAQPRLICSAAGGDGSHAAAADTTTVIEYLLLFRARPDADPEDVQDALDAAWSLQFMAPAIMCASVGAVASGSSSSSSSSTDKTAAYTHAVHFRVAQRASFDALLRNPLHAALLRDTLGPLTAAPAGEPAGSCGVLQIAFEARLPRDLEGLFRRGGEYGEGADAVLLLERPTAGAAAAAASNSGSGGAPGGPEDFVSRLAQLAESRAAGSLQASAGVVVSCAGGDNGGKKPSHVLVARFPSRAQAAAFLATPPCAAAAARDPRLPLHALCVLEVAVEPGDEASTRRQAV